MMIERGWVSIVGAGPGPLDLMTLRAVDRLDRATVVIHDRLIGAEIMARIPAHARKIDAGKAKGAHALPQSAIHELLVEHARQGHRVVRLKGGDPLVFGRGGEEMQALMAAGIPFEIVPGVTAAVGCAAAAGIALTHRDWAPSCVFLPGHRAQDDASLDWPTLARGSHTLVFYMGVTRLAAIGHQLIAHGLRPTTPAAMVIDGTRPDQRIHATTLQRLMLAPPPYGCSPGLLIVGETVRLSPHFSSPTQER
jgi:uroporphyrin-III C-methyltransferase